MSNKPTYEELEKRIQILEREALNHKLVERDTLMLRTAVDQVPVGIALADENLNIYYCNPEGLGLRGGNKGDLIDIPKDAFNNWQVLLLNGEPYEINNLPLVRAIKNGQTVREEFIVKHQDGSDHICNAIASPVYENKKIIGGIVIFMDITERKQVENALQKAHDGLEQKVEDRTIEIRESNKELLIEIAERKQAEQALRVSEEKYRLLAENVKDVIWVRDMDLKLKYVSPSVEKVRGYTPEEVMTQTIEEVLTPESTKTATDLFSRMLPAKDDERPEEYVIDLEHYCKNGKTIWLEHKLSWLYDSNGERSGILGVSRNITERMQLEDQLRQSHKMEAIGTLTGGVAHDFNNILGIILGNTELALDDVPEWNPAHFCLEDIKTASLRAAGIVKQLLSFSRKTTHVMKHIGIITVIKDALKLIRATIPTTIEVRKNIPDTDETILADPSQINQIIMNLCINASQEMEETGGILEVTVEKTTLDDEAVVNSSDFTKGDYVMLSVSDTGSGIGPKIIDRIFDPYFTTKEVGKGSGMGLSVVHGIVKNHNGVITVESELGKGTTFTILFPVVTEKPEAETETTDELPHGTETILFIDDEKYIVNMAGKMLERFGYHVETRTDPIEALELFHSKPDQFDLVITDMAMPKMTGVKLLKRLLEIRSDIPVIICTGHSDLIDEEKAEDMGVAAYVMKPIEKQNIAETIRRVLDKQ